MRKVERQEGTFWEVDADDVTYIHVVSSIRIIDIHKKMIVDYVIS